MNYIARPGAVRMGAALPAIDPRAMWSKAWFVDYDNGNNNNLTRCDTTRPLKTLAGAVAAMGRGDVVYLRPRPYDGTDPQGIVDSAVVIPAAKGNCSFIGCSTPNNPPFDMMVKGGAAGVIITVRAPGVSFENICFNRGSGTIAHIKAESESTNAAKKGWGLSLYNCHFRNGNAKANAGGAVWLDNHWYGSIRRCTFVNCQTGIYITASLDTNHIIEILDNQFHHTAAAGVAGIDCHISAAALIYGILISGNHFHGLCPAGLAGAAVSRYLTLTGALNGELSNNIFGAATAGTFGAAGDNALVPTTVKMANNYREDAVANVPITRT